MEKDARTRFFHNASAYGFGGHVSVPGSFSEVLEVQAAISLPSVGGRGEARSPIYDYNRPPASFSFVSAVSEVTGYRREDGTHQSVATVTVTGLNIMKRVTADRVVARLVSTEGLELELLPVGSFIENLRIDNFQVTTIFDDPLMTVRTFSGLSGIGKVPSLAPAKKQAEETAVFPPFEDCYVLTSIFREVQVEPGYLQVDGSSILVPDLGRVRLGEFLISRGARLLNMIVCELGCPVDGEMAVSGVRGNGHGY